MTRQLMQTEMPISVLPQMLPHIIPKLTTDKKLIEGCWLQLEDFKYFFCMCVKFSHKWVTMETDGLSSCDIAISL